MIWALLALAVFVVQIAAVLAAEFRRPAKAVAWLLVLFACPPLGFFLYYYLAREYKAKRSFTERAAGSRELSHAALSRCKPVSSLSDVNGDRFEHQERLFGLLQSFAASPATCRNETKVLTNAEAAFAAIFDAIASARHHIHVEYYTIRADEIGQRFKDALIRKAKEGVEVRVIYDGLGSVGLAQSYIDELRDAGVRTQCFLAPKIAFFEKRMNYRNHRKNVIVDGRIGFVGGINIGDEYLGADPKLGFWRDTHLQLEGDAVYFLQNVFLKDWRFTAGERLEASKYMPVHGCAGRERVQIVASGPDTADDRTLEYVFAAVSAAKIRLYITTPYFIPDPSVLMGLRTAALSGVDVRIILPGVADTKIVLYASLSYVEEMLAAGVRIYRYRSGFIHAKVMIVDDLLASVGTANMDMRSFYSNFELNALLLSEPAIRRLEADFRQDLLNSDELDLHTFRKRSRRQKAYEAAARMLSPLL
ncbi:cardiolipin synthase [Paenibacillus humicola]|uniref:cardiolipin synthase n=1 Tax=Paenibacillus humicola TaxID=3110540 RepID=UPI00237B871F|nr:cardiolipin synthase [Paenibacillus humicola]